MVDTSVFRKYSLFDGLEQEQINNILSKMENENFEAGANIIVEGGHNDKLRFILEGRVAVVKGGLVLMELDEGSIFGEVELLDVEPVAATVKTLAATKVMSLSIDAMGEIYESDLKTYSFILMNLARDLSRRLRRMNSKIADDSPVMEWN